MSRCLLAAVLLAGLPAAAPAQLPADKDQLASDLRGLLLKHLPDPLYEGQKNWGHQSEGSKFKFRGKLREIHIELQHPLKNDGVWRKFRVDAERPAETLTLEVRKLDKDESGKLMLTVAVAADVRFDVTSQRWAAGVKLLDASVRGRMRVTEVVDVEAVTRVERKGLLPELVVQAKVLSSNVGYERLKFDHVAGLGGDAAEVIGDTAHAALHQWKPSLERHLLEKADAAVVKAGESKEIRIGLAKFLDKKK